MGLSVATGSFTITAGTGTQAVTISPAFQPKVVIAYWTNQSTDDAFAALNINGQGWAVDASPDQQVCMTSWTNDNLATTDSDVHKSTTKFIRIHSGNATFAVEATISSFDSNGFTINKSANASGTNKIVKYLCLGGTDISNAYLGEFTGGNVEGANKAFTGVGFQGKLAFFMGMNSVLSGDQQASAAGYSFGAAVSQTSQDSVSWGSTDNTTSTGSAQTDTWMGLVNSYCFGPMLTSLPGPSVFSGFRSFDADGFTINFAGIATSNCRFFALVLGGTFNVNIKRYSRPTSNGTVNYTDPAFPPKALIIAGGRGTANGTTTPTSMAFGTAVDDGSITQRGMWIGDAGTINSDANMYTSSTKIYTEATNPSTISAQAAVSAWRSDGYTLNWSTTDTNARLFFHVALGAAVTGYTITAAGGSYTLSGQDVTFRVGSPTYLRYRK